MPLYQALDRAQGVGHMFVALRIEAFEPLEAFQERVDDAIRGIRALPLAANASRVFLPGEPEHLRAQQHEARGIPLPRDAVAELARTASILGLAAPPAHEAPVA